MTEAGTGLKLTEAEDLVELYFAVDMQGGQEVEIPLGSSRPVHRRSGTRRTGRHGTYLMAHLVGSLMLLQLG